MHRLIFALLSVSCLQAQQISFQGVVTDAVTHQPMAGVHVILAPASSRDEVGRQTWGAISRKDGAFSIRELPPGTYVFDAHYNGYFQIPAKTPDGHDDPFVTLKSDEEPKDVSIQMAPHAVITGRVIDENGDPVAHVPMTVHSAEGWTSQTDVDDRGQYRFSLPPGKYYVEAMAQGLGGVQSMGGLQEIRSDGSLPLTLGNTFYPSTPSKDNATPIELGPGQSANGIDIRLMSLVTTKISGTVTGMPPDDEAHHTPAFIFLTQVLTSGNFEPLMRTATAGSDGKFTITGIPAGHYRLVARSADLQSAPVEVFTENGDGANLTLALLHSETLRGTLRIDGDAAQSAAEKLTVRLESHSPFARSFAGEIGTDGKFQVDQVFPGRFSVNVLPLPENAYIKSIKVGATESADGFIDLSGGASGAPVDIVISRDGGQIEGTVVDRDGKPWSAGRFAEVVLAPDDANTDLDMQQVEPGEKFIFQGLRPGTYRLIAAEQLPGRDREALRSLLSRAPEIEVHEKDRISNDLKITAVESADAK